MKGDGWQTLGLSDLEPILAAGVHWKPPRRTLWIEAFGTNAYGAKPGEPYMPSAREWYFEAEKFRPSMDADAALAFVSEGLERFPDHMGMLFSIACWQAMGGREDEALETLRRAEALDPRVREWVAKDEDLASVRDRFFEEQP